MGLLRPVEESPYRLLASLSKAFATPYILWRANGFERFLGFKRDPCRVSTTFR